MKLKVTNIPAFSLAMICTARKTYNSVFQGVHFEPSGAVAGTDGFRLAWHPEAVEPFEGQPLTVKIDKAPPVDARSVEIDTDAGTVTWETKGGKVGITTCSVIDATFPDFRRVTPADDAEEVPVGRLGFNAVYVAEMSKALNAHEVAGQVSMRHVSTGGSGTMLRFDSADPKQVAVLVPLRLS